ncbi:DUF1573 domain-containing protein [Thermodesulfobacteriota bacterium]
MIRRNLIAAILITILPQVLFAASGPKIHFDKEKIDLGPVPYGTKAVAEYEFTNVGDETLIIEKLRSTCGCTKAVKGSREVAPGEKSKITASFDTTNLTPGRKRKSVYVHSNDTDSPVVPLALYAEVVRELTFQPRSLTTRITSPKPEVTFTVQVSNDSKNTVTINKVKAALPAVGAEIKPGTITVKPGTRAPFNLTLRFAPKESTTKYSGFAVLFTDHAREKKANLRYYIRISPDDAGKSKEK